MNHAVEKIARASEHWQAGRFLEAGELLFDSLPPPTRPHWAAKVLDAAVLRSGVHFEPIDYVLHLATHPSEWGEAHGAFSTLRKSTLVLEKTKPRTNEQELLLCLLYLAENVAKVTYNASGLPWAFDEDSGWWIARCFNDFVDVLGDEKFAQQSWSILSDRIEGEIGLP